MLLYRYFSKNLELFSYAAATKVVITEESTAVVRYLCQELPCLRRLCQTKMTDENRSKITDILFHVRK